jgi:hypothetical protein
LEETITKDCRFSDAKPDMDLKEGLVIAYGTKRLYYLVQSLDVLVIESAMHKLVEHLIELRRVTFVDVPIPFDGPAHHMRSATWSANPSSIERRSCTFANFN